MRLKGPVPVALARETLNGAPLQGALGVAASVAVGGVQARTVSVAVGVGRLSLEIASSASDGLGNALLNDTAVVPPGGTRNTLKVIVRKVKSVFGCVFAGWLVP